MHRRKRFRAQEEEPTSFWQSYSDLMAAMLLMFILIMILALAETGKYEKSYKKADDTKTAITKDLLEEFENDDIVTVDKGTGIITFDEGLLFDTNESELIESNKKLLSEKLKKYFNILLSDKYYNIIDEIIIEGYTDDTGEYMHNLKLSQDRAFEVAKYCLENNVIEKEDIPLAKIKLTAVGRADNKLITRHRGNIYSEEEQDKSRRVEIRFTVKNTPKDIEEN